VGAFALALRPCRYVVEPGRVLAYRLATTCDEEQADGTWRPTLREERRIELTGIGPDDGRAALVVASGGGTSAVALVQVHEHGAVRQCDADGRATARGVAIAGFDFSLLALPPGGADQEWRPEVAYAALPATCPPVAAEARRLKAGARPEFRLRFPDSVEWIDPGTGRYRQVRRLRADYRFDGLRAAPLTATVSYQFSQELPEPAGVRRLRIEHVLELVESGSAQAEVARLRAAAEAAAAVQTWVQARRPPPPALVQSLRADGDLPPLLGQTLARLAGRARGLR
jgi:hypothetical protein